MVDGMILSAHKKKLEVIFERGHKWRFYFDLPIMEFIVCLWVQKGSGFLYLDIMLPDSGYIDRYSQK